MILEVDNLELLFGDRKILHSVYIKAEQGKITGILGKNGSGKTCLLRILFGSLLPKYKNIRINGKNIGKPLFKYGNCSYLPQHKLLPKAFKLSKAFKFYDLEWDDFVADFSDFKKYENAKTGELSSGEQRLVEAYLTICSNKEIILLDEPFSFLAPVYVQKLKSLIKKQSAYSAFIVTDHFYEDILEISNSIYFLKDGYAKSISSKKDLEWEGYLLSK